MKFSLKARVLFLLVVLTLIPIALYFYHNSAMRKNILEDRFRLHSIYASSVVSRVELFLERVMSETDSAVYLYRNFGFSEEETIWRITGQVKGVFEGAFYTPEGILMSAVSRESSEPKFEKFMNIDSSKRVLGILYTQYKEPFLRFVVPEVENGVLRGFFLFSLDLSLFWQSVISAKPSPSVDIFLTDSEGNILAFSDMRFSERRKIPLRQGVYLSSVTGTEVVGAHAKSDDGKWVVFIEEPVKAVLKPLYNFQEKALIAGSVFMLSVGTFAIFVFLRIFKPLENLKNYVITWEERNIRVPIEAGDEVGELSQAFENLIKKLQEERRLYLSLFDNTLDGVMVFNSYRRIIDVNRTVLENFHISKEELLGKHMKDLIGEELPFTRLFFPEKRVNLKEQVLCQLRQEILKIEENFYILWRLRDISHEKELKVLLEQTAKLSLAGEIACSIAHQVNNPLASIMGYAESICLNSQDEEAKRKAEVIFKQAQKCAETVRKLLEIGKPFEGKPEYIKPEEVTIEAIKMLSPKAKRKWVKIEFENSLNGERLFSFPWQIEQVLINVIDNAIDASPKEGKVSIKLFKNNGSIFWRIEDEGPGIKDMDKIFKPFYTTKPYGTGLGLSLARRLIRNLGGDVKIRNKPDKGTVVEIHVSEVKNETPNS
ncbi:two-component system NtrC family sensor kinase [Hydrogenivirga caldilitoris]|uniref:histidine kinase n=1 Tax=Hydrogenivirga caldilitoris TaxID=246264 RepID=A0A497XPB7_9AQUI|nr:PAS domain-containing sensor histidine kinase [Hydrogenivirga caldilitoris]RLJ69980.1 two-component system NtrC family sensor kinase [Hydrogenivirga caldilitoris]